MILIDTNIYSDALRGLEPAVTILRRAPTILISPVVVGELLGGFKMGAREGQNRDQFERFLSKEGVRQISIGAETSQRYAFIFALLKEAGTPIPTNDIWIAASAMEHGAILATADVHFRKIMGLMLVQSGPD